MHRYKLIQLTSGCILCNTAAKELILSKKKKTREGGEEGWGGGEGWAEKAENCT